MAVEIKPILREFCIAAGLGILTWLFGGDGTTVFFLTLLVRYTFKGRKERFE